MLVHKTIASGVMPCNTDLGNLASYKLYESETTSGTHLKSIVLHNLSGDLGFIDVRLYLNVTVAEEMHYNDNAPPYPLEPDSTQRILNISVADHDTAEWEFAYPVHLRDGETIFGETDYPNLINYYILAAEDEGCNTACP